MILNSGLRGTQAMNQTPYVHLSTEKMFCHCKVQKYLQEYRVVAAPSTFYMKEHCWSLKQSREASRLWAKDVLQAISVSHFSHFFFTCADSSEKRGRPPKQCQKQFRRKWYPPKQFQKEIMQNQLQKKGIHRQSCRITHWPHKALSTAFLCFKKILFLQNSCIWARRVSALIVAFGAQVWPKVTLQSPLSRVQLALLQSRSVHSSDFLCMSSIGPNYC